MTTLREKVLPLFSKARISLIDAKAGLRRFTLYRRTRTPSDGRGGVGTTWTVVDVQLPERPHVRLATAKDVVEGVGRVKIGDFILSRITPQSADGAVGIAPDWFRLQPASPGQQVFYVLAPVDPNHDDVPAYNAGPPPSGGAECTVVWVNATKNFGIEVVLTPATGER